MARTPPRAARYASTRHLPPHRGLDIERQSSARECLLDIPRWDFHWQASYALTQPRVIQPGTSCHWNNSAPGAAEATWGEGTGDAMCLDLFYMTQ